MEAKDIVFESVMSKEDTERFHVEDMLLDSEDGYYSCCVYNNESGK